ncbi:hypothetical protein [Pseudomonas triticifolii]|uniref:Uncharacterized protein n=1 Tax=Pseudomonas triticifolii TaxID=2762592 RepID=A0ABR7B918_9PSED|nr:hypothetical protein [Pseudomonas triticifolii]MBC3953672.1 hypothetical protein [Pseudomonas triticifolii]
MKHTLVLVSVCFSSLAWSASSITEITKPFGKHIHALSNAFACDILAGTRLNQAPQCRNRDNPALTDSRDIDKAADRKSLRECIKPDNLIDDDVRKCMKGF